MHESLCVVNDLFSRLIMNDFESINIAIDEVIWWINGYVSIMKDELH